MNTETTIASESFIFLLFVVSGVFSGIIYDVVNIVRNKLNKPTGIYDILSGAVLSLFIVFCFLKINDLTIGISSFLGIITGCTLYFYVFSAFFCPILKFFCNFFEKIFKILLYPAKLSCIIVKDYYRFIVRTLTSLRNILFDSAKKLILKFKKI